MTPPAVPSVAGDELTKALDALYKAWRENAQAWTDESQGAVNEAHAAILSLVALLRERAERAEAERDGFRNGQEQQAHLFDLLWKDVYQPGGLRDQRDAAQTEGRKLMEENAEVRARASAAEAESERLRESLRVANRALVAHGAAPVAGAPVGETETAKGPGGARRGGR